MKKGWPTTKHVDIRTRLAAEKAHQARKDAFFQDAGPSKGGSDGPATSPPRDGRSRGRAKTPAALSLRRDTKDARAMRGSTLADATAAPDKFGTYTKLEHYLRGRPKTPERGPDAAPAEPDFSYLLQGPIGDGWRGQVLVVDADLEAAHDVVEMLVEEVTP